MKRQRRDRAVGPRLRRRSARFRLTALYCGLFFPAGVVLVGVTYVVIVLSQQPTEIGRLHLGRTPHGSRTRSVRVKLPGHIVLHGYEVLAGAGVVLVAMIGLSVLIGWLVAGRVLRPLRDITATTRQISERNLHERVSLTGPDDELKHLGDTIDELLARLEAAFDSQRRFVANASHELRTPLMLNQTILQVALADPGITLDSLRAACEEVIEAGKDQARLIDALLTLARSQRGLETHEPVDLAPLIREALAAHRPAAAARGLRVDASLDDAKVSGDPRLIHRLVSNLIDNAIRHNVRAGQIHLTLASNPTEAALTVTNSGPLVPPDQVNRLLEPFQRAAPDRIGSGDGLGLGLSIVANIADAHGAGLRVCPGAEGGLTITVSFPQGGQPGYEL